MSRPEHLYVVVGCSEPGNNPKLFVSKVVGEDEYNYFLDRTLGPEIPSRPNTRPYMAKDQVGRFICDSEEQALRAFVHLESEAVNEAEKKLRHATANVMWARERLNAIVQGF